MGKSQVIGFACAYTPLALIHAAGFTPFRVLPNVDCPDQAAQLLHDNLCPHVKRILDRAMSGNLPELEGMVFMNSCDAMRRLYDAWQIVRPEDKTILVDLPVTASANSIAFFRGELQRAAAILETWGDTLITREKVAGSIQLYNQLAENFAKLRYSGQNGSFQIGAAALQKACNMASCEAPEKSVGHLESLLVDPGVQPQEDRLPIYLFGNMLPEPEAFDLFEACGARIIGEDLCTGSRIFKKITAGSSGDIFLDLAGGILRSQPCARTFDGSLPGRLARDIVAEARSRRVRGVIGYTVKFCDPYLARLPGIRETLKNAGIPFLFLEGDCTMRSMGQQQTRIEAFIEMLR
jgi:benzoyl-CoA reductase/2-hydroxyglutaryl-CoA dehydratase subunit BcrC/BadD/HgdB